MRYGLYIELSRCIGCHACVVGCESLNSRAEGSGRIRILDFTLGSYPDVTRWIVPLPCMQCEHPPCVSVCRFSACTRGDGGIVRVDAHRCVGCGLCVLACPYGARRLRPETGCADGCDLCRERLSDGRQPLCVETCPGEAILFGDLDNPQSEIRKRMEEGGADFLGKTYKTRPRVFYGGLEKLIQASPDALSVLESEIARRAQIKS